MRARRLAATAAALVLIGASAGPVQQLDRLPIPAPRDHVFAGTIALDVDATDTAHRLFGVVERIPVQAAGPMVLLYPRWDAASHGPSLTVTDLAGLSISAGGRPLGWRRDPLDPHAFHIAVPEGVAEIRVRFQVVGTRDELAPGAVAVPWQRLALYPAGWYARNIPVAASVRVPAGLRAVSSLATVPRPDAATRFAPVSLEMLFDSPVYAGGNVASVALSSGDTPVTLNLFAQRTEDLTLPSARVAELRRMVTQARAVFGPPPFRRYDLLMRLRDDAAAGGVEHRRSGEIAAPSGYFRDWSAQLEDRDIVPHEFAHAWNGLWRVPADLWAPTPNVPQGHSLLWVYEGQTEFWGRVLAARAGLRTPAETLDRLALDAAEAAQRPGRSWRPLADDIAYPAFMLRQPVPWRDWQRRKDYYGEGVLLWLAVDARLRSLSGGRHGIDDFARSFFADASNAAPARTYTFDDLARALEAIAPGDWTRFLRGWLDGRAELDPLAGLTAQGWALTFTDTPTPTFAAHEAGLGVADLTYSIGLAVTDQGAVRSVAWEGPAFKAGLAPGSRIVAVAGEAFGRPALLDAVRDATTKPVVLTVEQDGVRAERTLAWRGSLRYPRLTRIAGRPDRLSALLAPR